MNASPSFESVPVGNEFETAAEEFERGRYGRSTTSRRSPAQRGGYSARRSSQRQSMQRRQSMQQRQANRYQPQSSSSRSRRGARPYGYSAWAPWGVDPLPFGAGAQYRRCMQSCLAAGMPPPPDAPDPAPADAAPPDAAGGPSADASSSSPDQEIAMHKLSCQCSRCNPGARAFDVMDFRSRQGEAFEAEGEQEGEYEGEQESQYEGPMGGEYEYEGEGEGEAEYEGPFSESEEIALAAELLSVSNEAELEQFLGGLWKGIKKVGSTVIKAAKPFTGVLRAVAKTALPFVGGALGSMIPIPGVGTAVGTALGGALSKALEMEYGELELEDREFEMARSFVRIAGNAAKDFRPPTDGGSMTAAVQAAIANAAQQQLPHFRPHARQVSPAMSGSWKRHGRTLVVIGA